MGTRITSLLVALILGLTVIAFCGIASGSGGSTEELVQKAKALDQQARDLQREAGELEGAAACAKWREAQKMWEKAADAWGEVPPPPPGFVGMDQAVEMANRDRLYATMINQHLVSCK